MASNYQRIKHKRSGVEGKRPTTDILAAGEISINYNSNDPGLFITTSADTIAKIGPTSVGTTAPNINPPSGGYPANSDGEQWFETQNRVLKVYNETDREWQDVLSPLAAQSKNVITVSQDSEYASDAMFNDGKIRPFKTLQRALLQVAKESVQKDPLTDDANYSIFVSPGRYSVPNKGTSSTSPTVEISSNRYGNSSAGLAQNETATITFTFSSEPALFDLTMVTATYGTLSNLQQNSNFSYIYTASFVRTDAANYGVITIADGAFTDKDGVSGIGATIDLSTTVQATTVTSIYERDSSYEPTDEDYERMNVNEGIVIPRGTTIIGASQRAVYFTGNYNSQSATRTPIFRVTQESQIRDLTVIDKNASGLVLLDETNAALSRLRFSDPHGLRSGDTISFSRFQGADIYSPLVYGKSYNIVKIDDYTVELYSGTSRVTLVPGTASAISDVVANYAVSTDNLKLVNVHAWELVSDADLKKYYERVASELFAPGTKLYTNTEKWETTAVAPTTSLEIDDVRKASVYFKDIAVRSKYGMSGWLIDGSVSSGLKSTHLASCTLVSLQTDPTAWEVYNATTKTWGAPAGATVDEQRQAVIDSALNNIRIKTARNSDGTINAATDSRFFFIHASNQSYVSTFSCYAIGSSDHFIATSGGYINNASSVSNFGGVGLTAEGFAGIGTTTGALPQDTGWFIEGFLRPLKVDTTEAADRATEIKLGVSIKEVLAGTSGDPRVTSDNIAAGETAFYFDKFYSETVPLPFSVYASSAIYIYAPTSYYRAILTADPYIKDTNGAIIGFRTSSTNNAIAQLGVAVIGEELLIRRFVDPRSEIERNPQILIQGKDQQPVQRNNILRLTSGGKGTNGTQLIKQGAQIDPVLNNDPSHVFEVVDFTTKELGENPNEVLKSFNNIFAPTNEYYVTLQRNGEFGPWDAGKNYVKGDLVSYSNRNYVCVSPVIGGSTPDTSDSWLNSQIYQNGVSHINTISSVGLTVNVINKDDGTRSMGITEDDLNPTYHPVQRAVRGFLELLGVSAADILTILRPETRANRLFTVNDMLTAGMQVSGAGFVTQVGTWPIEFNRPSIVSSLSHGWDLCGYWNYSTAIPTLRDSQLTAREELDYLYSEALGGLVFANGQTQTNEYVFSSPYRDIYGGGLYDIREEGKTTSLFTTSSETTSGQEVFYQAIAPSSPSFGTIWINSSVTPNIFQYWNGAAWVAVGGVDSFNGRTGAVLPAPGDYNASSLSDVDTTGAVAGQVLKYNGANWVPGADNDTVYTLPSSTEAVVGGIEIATQAEADAGADDTRAITPAKLAGYATNVLDARYSATGSGVLSFNGRTGVITPAEADYNLGQMGDVDTTGAANGQVLKYNGANWVPQADNSVTTIGGLTDVDTTGVVSGQVLKYNGANWVPAADDDTTPTVNRVAAPTASSDPGALGDVAMDATYFYWHDGAQWQRVAADVTVW